MAIISIPTSVGGVSLPGAIGQIASGPLAALFGGRALTTLNYPTELATDATKSHYVTFSIKEIQAAGFDNTTTQQGANLTLPGAAKAVDALADTIVGKAAGAVGGVITSAVDYVGGAVSSEFANVGTDTAKGLSSALKTGLKITPPVTAIRALISLYMPDTMNSDYKAVWDDVDLAEALGSKIQTIRALDQLAGKGISAGAGGGADIKTAKSVYGAISNDPAAIGLAVKAAAGLAGKFGADSDKLGAILLQGQGYAVNPQLQMLYKGLATRSFQLSFTFSPKSKKEAKVVDDIIYNFKYYAAPAFTSGATVSSQSMYLTPPSIFSVRFFSNGKENTFLPRYTDCVLEDINVNFAPNGFAAHTDGAPIQTQLTLQFKEIEIVDKGRLEKGHNGSNAAEGLR